LEEVGDLSSLIDAGIHHHQVPLYSPSSISALTTILDLYVDLVESNMWEGEKPFVRVKEWYRTSISRISSSLSSSASNSSLEMKVPLSDFENLLHSPSTSFSSSQLNHLSITSFNHRNTISLSIFK